MLTNFLDKGAEKASNILPVCLVRSSMYSVGEGVAAQQLSSDCMEDVCMEEYISSASLKPISR